MRGLRRGRGADGRATHVRTAEWARRAGIALAHRACTLGLAILGGLAQAAPNVVLVVIDNAVIQEVDAMPLTAAYLRTNGVEFSNAYVTNSLCSASRASILTGKYSHNTGVMNNSQPGGGFDGFHSKGNEQATIATWMKSRGYRTALVGKYFNGYVAPKTAPPTFVPPGWDRWYGYSSKETYFNYTLNENGRLVSYGSAMADYLTDRLAEKASAVLTDFVASGRPFFLYLAPISPHEDNARNDGLPTPAPRHAGLFGSLKAPRNPSFGESDISDKPLWLRNQATPLTPDVIERIDESYRARARTLRAVDDMVAGLIDQLRRAAVLDNTVIMLLSDNGFFFGEHQKTRGNGPMYEAVSRVPLLAAGPGIAAGRRSKARVVNIDLFPTLAELAGGAAPSTVDGRSVAAVLRNTSTASGRKSFLRVMATSGGGAGLRLPSFTYYETRGTGVSPTFRELYDLRTDPDELRNLAPQLTSASAARLSDAVARFKRCTGSACRQLEATVDDSYVALAASPP